MTRLRQRMIEDMNLRNLALRIVKAYVERVAKLAHCFRKSPEHLRRADVRKGRMVGVEELPPILIGPEALAQFGGDFVFDSS